MSRDKANFDRIYRDNYIFVRDAATRMIGPNMGEDIAQETMLAAWQNLHRFNGRSALRTWLYRIMVNICLMEIRKRKPDLVDCDDVTLPVSSCAEQVIAKLTVATLLPRLRPRARAIMAMHYLREMPVREIAESWGTSKGYVSGSLSRSRCALEAERKYER